MARYRLLRRLTAPLRLLERHFPQSAMIRALSDRLCFIRSVYGVHLLNTPGDRTYELCATGYGRFVADAIAGQARPFVFLDIGANLGLFSLIAAKNPCCVKGFAFEPIPQTFETLRANLRRAHAERIEPICGAITNVADALVYLSFTDRHSGMAKIVEKRPDAVAARVISAAALDTLVPAGTVVAKIDVEGWEVEVIATLRQTRFYASVEEIIIEVSERNLGSDRRAALLRMLAEDGYIELSRAGPAEHYDARYRLHRAQLPQQC